MKANLADLRPIAFSRHECARELQGFRKLLDQKTELSENKDILPFFKRSRHLSALIGACNPYVGSFDCLAYEYDLFGDFACDVVVGDRTKNAFTLLEFEDATSRSLFCQGSKFTHEWSKRYEHGFSQLVDWFWSLADQRQTSAFRDRFGSNNARFTGMLVLGRSCFVKDRERRRLAWRAEKVIIDSNAITCMTFDDLYGFLQDKLTSFAQAGRSAAQATNKVPKKVIVAPRLVLSAKKQTRRLKK